MPRRTLLARATFALPVLLATLAACTARPLASSTDSAGGSSAASSSAQAAGASPPSATAAAGATATTSGVPAARDAQVAAPLTVPTYEPQRVLGGAGKWTTLRVPVSDDPSTRIRTVTVFTPPVADPSDLPVVYFLHGLPGGASDLCNPSTAKTLLAAFRAGAQAFVLACPDGNPAGQSDSEWADSADGRTKLESFLTGPAINAVEGTELRPRSMRALAGFSMGGFGAASVALRHPDLYSQVVSLAGYFHLDDPDKVFGTTKSSQNDHDPTALVSQATNLRWFLAEADEDNEALTAHDAERYTTLLRKVGATVQLTRTAGPHGPSWAINQLPSVARFLALGWSG